MKQASKESTGRRQLWALPLALAMLAAVCAAAIAQVESAPIYAGTVVEPVKYYSGGLAPSQDLSGLLPAETAEMHAVNYYLRDPLGNTWMHYFTEEREHGRLARGPLYNPIEPTGDYEQVFIGWYGDEGLTAGPVNLLRMPVTADLSLYARFGDEADAFQPTALEVVITLLPSLGFAGAEGVPEDGEPGAAADPEPIPEEIAAAIQGGGEALPQGLVCTITAQVEGVPEDVRYSLQWQNDLSGELADIPGETGSSITFPASRENLDCEWRLALSF